jgi:hypothetical protein
MMLRKLFEPTKSWLGLHKEELHDIQGVHHKICQTSRYYFMGNFHLKKFLYQHMYDYQPLHRCEHILYHTVQIK